MMVFYEDYKHALMSEKRWFIDDSGLLSKKFNPMVFLTDHLLKTKTFFFRIQCQNLYLI